MAYHARPYPEIHSGSAAGGLFDQDRNTWVKAVNVRANGMLDMSLTKDQEVAPANRTVTITVTVGEPDTPVEPSITGIRVKSEPTKTKYTVGEQFSADGLAIEATMSDGTVKSARCRRLHGRRRGHDPLWAPRPSPSRSRPTISSPRRSW
ncbi:MAG: bacterial Ig-like domain-containing protein [Bifidobacterium sp.]